MKKLLMLCVAFCFALPLKAQLVAVEVDAYGECLFIVKVSSVGEVVISSEGEIIDTNLKGREVYASGYNNNFNNRNEGFNHGYDRYSTSNRDRSVHNRRAVITSIGNVKFEYYNDFRPYEAGRIKRIGNVSFTYCSDFRPYEAGKIKSIGTVRLTYCSNFRDYEAGKVKSIGSTSFTYYSNFRAEEAGLIKTIGNHTFQHQSTRSTRRDFLYNVRKRIDKFVFNKIEYTVTY